jgi:hypothetical protein
MLVYFCAAGFVVYKGYTIMGAVVLLLGWPFVIAAGLIAQSFVVSLLPPKLEPYAQHGTWLNLR